MNYFGYKYRGTGRWTGRTCLRHHEYQPPERPGEVGFWVGKGCAHPESDGEVFEDYIKWWEEFTLQQHNACHEPLRPDHSCLHCRLAGWLEGR
jgi:hypothetical protein